MPKEKMIEALGERELLLPGLVAAASSANDRVKYLLTLLQTARSAADGAPGASNLREERLTSGVEEADLDRVVADSVRRPDGSYVIHGAQQLARRAIGEVRAMTAPLDAAAVPAAPGLRRRVDAIAAGLAVEGDMISGADLARLTAGRPDGGDSLHLVVMDAHRELHALQERIATESVDGAGTYGLEDRDRDLVRAFMRGVHATERLKFDHPGLGTTAARVEPALVIENDLGETDAHVLVIRILERDVTITYTDVHLVRLMFFQRLFEPWQVTWEDTRSRTDRSIEDGMYHLASARFEAGSVAEIERFLEHLGSRLVFIIDWNRARKRLRRLVGRQAAIDLLGWAAEHGYGHIAFLRAGGDELVYDALEFAGGRAARAGESLQDVLGREAATAYLRAVLRICSEGLLGGQAVSLVQDEVRAELTGYLRSARQEILTLVLRHAVLSAEIAEAARDAVEYAIIGAPDQCRVLAGRAADAEHQADVLVGETRLAVGRAPDLGPFLELVEAADDIADCGEEAAFYATLLPDGHPAGGVRPQVRRIARLVLTASRAYLRAVQLSVELRRGGPREEMDAFLSAAHEAITLEHSTDEAQRAVHQAMVAEAADSGAAQFVVIELTRAFEEAADALMHAAHLVRKHTLARLVGSEAVPRRAADAPPARSSVVSSPGRADHVYVLGDPRLPVPDASVIGGKAHGLARLNRAGLRVPEAAVLTTEFWRSRQSSAAYEASLRRTVRSAAEVVEQQTGLQLASSSRPLLLSVRSGAPVSMPGMLETVLNVGMCESATRGLIALTGNPRLAWDSYRRLIESFAAVVRGCPRAQFEHAVQQELAAAGVARPRELGAGVLERVTRAHLDRYADLTGEQFPQDPMEQLVAAVTAVLDSWNAPKAREYRRLHGIPQGMGTAVILQRMVFGNAGGVSGSGVGFTRDPALGGHQLYIDFLLDAQGEDIVGGRQTAEGLGELALAAPDLVAEIERVAELLETEFTDAQEFELTVQEGELFLLQTRTAKRTPWAALRIATDLVHERLITPSVALERLAPLDLGDIRRIHVKAPDGIAELARATPASVGVGTGPLALDRRAAQKFARAGRPPVLARPDTTTEDVPAVAVAAGIVTAAGGRTAHAAVVARELGKPCLVGCPELEIDLESRTARIGERVLAEGEVLCVDAEAGRIFLGAPELIEERPVRELAEVATWRASANRDQQQPPGAR
jgi:uncharacterized protein Yka (UPF0111/DUF47 family)/phosphohistidine swiveling domain-containing protein